MKPSASLSTLGEMKTRKWPRCMCSRLLSYTRPGSALNKHAGRKMQQITEIFMNREYIEVTYSICRTP